MKRLILALVAALFLVISCSHAKTPIITHNPTIEEIKWRRQDFVSVNHWVYSQWGYWDGTQEEELQAAIDENWFGELVPED